MIVCTNKGTTHTHETVMDSKICYGIILPPPPTVRPHEIHSSRYGITVRQLNYIVNILGGDEAAAKGMDRLTASKYIDTLKRGVKPVTAEPWTPPAPVKRPTDPRLDLLSGIISMIPDGYFATQAEDGAKVNFVRLSHPRRNKYAGGLKIQTQHAERLETEAVLWPSGSWSIYRSSIVDILMLLVVDHRTAALRYGRESKRCTRCNTSLTDGPSLHYGIGPVCDKEWPWVIDMVDEANDGKCYEQLVREGSPLVISRRS